MIKDVIIPKVWWQCSLLLGDRRDNGEEIETNGCVPEQKNGAVEEFYPDNGLAILILPCHKSARSTLHSRFSHVRTIAPSRRGKCSIPNATTSALLKSTCCANTKACRVLAAGFVIP